VDAQDKFKQLLKALTPFLKAYGNTRRGQNFHTRRDGNWGVINFQRGRYAELKFTVNLGVFSQTIDNFYQEWGKDKDAPPERGCDHWRDRIGSLLPRRLDKWWVIDGETELPDLIEELKAALPLGIAEIEKHIRDEDFRDYLLAGNCAGYSDLHRLKCLAVLVTEYGPSERLAAIFDEWQQRSLFRDDVKQETEGYIKRLKQIAEAKNLPLVTGSS
jgi:hypothetical protein